MRIPPYFPRLGALALACALALPAQAAERAWSYSYNALGLIERADGPRTDVQDVTLYAYDSRGNLTQVTNALGQVTRLGDYDERGKPGSITDANGVTSSLAYTGVDGWLASVSTAGSTTRFDYDAVGQITRVTRGDGSWLSYEYDDARRLVAIGNNLGERLEYDVDTKGNRTAQRIKDASGSMVRQQQWAYDELGRLLRAVGAGGQTRSFAYDLNDNPVGETNPRQFAHSQAFDALDRLVGQSDPLGGKTQLAYDAQDNLTEVKDPRGVTTRYEYDGLGNLTRLVSPDSGTTTFEHDAAGNVIRRTDARGAVTEYRYDALNRLIERHSPSDPSLDVQYRYDLTADGNKGIGRLGAIEGARDSLVYRYDERGNLVEQVRSIRLDQQTLLDRVTYRYDAANQLLEIGYPSGLAIGYPRNAGGQVASVTLAVGDKAPSTLVGLIAYLPFGPLQRLTWGNGITLSREYDQDYQLLRQKVGPWQSDYQHDANGNIQQHRHSLWGTLDYQYDPLDRLTEERGVQGGRSYAYDAVGNRTQRSDNPASGGTASSQDYQYAPDSNRLTAIGAQAVTSDAAGNLTQDRAARKLAYDAQGRLQSVSLDGQQVAEYRYNALGQRIVKLTPESITTYLYGPGGQLLGEYLAVDVRSAEDQAYLQPLQALALLPGGGQRRHPGALGDVVGAGEAQAHGRADLPVADPHQTIGAGQDHFQRARVRRTARHAVGQAGVDRVADRRAGLERQGVGRRMGGHHADDAGLQAQRVARGDQAADARTHTDRHVDFVKVGQRGEQLQAVAGDPGHQPGMERRNQVQAFAPGALGGVFAGGLEVLAVLDQLRAKAAHRRVLLAAVAVRHDDDRLDAVAARREGHRLAVVAASRADHGGRPLALVRQVVEIHQAAAQFEGPHRQVVLVLHPHFATQCLA